MADPPVILNGTIRHCPLGIINSASKVNVFADCHYASVCPTPCSPLQRLAMQIEEEKHDHNRARTV